MSNPFDTVEVAVEQRLVGLMSATRTLRTLSQDGAGREVIGRQQCIQDIELVRDQLSRILADVSPR